MILLWEVPNKLSTEAPLIIVSLEIFSLNSLNEVLFIVLFKMVLTFKSADETLQCATIHKNRVVLFIKLVKFITSSSCSRVLERDL